MTILCAASGCLNRVRVAKEGPFPAYCPPHRCSCLAPESLLGCGDRAQARRLWQAARADCEVHG